VVLEKDGEDQLEQSCENEEVIHRGKIENILNRLNKKAGNWIGHHLLRNCLLKHVIEES
jgi:hypothetical protein